MEEIPQPEIIDNDAVRGQKAEVDGKKGDGNGKKEAIDKSSPHVQPSARQDLVVFKQMCARHQADALLDLACRACGIDEQQPNGQNRDDHQEKQEKRR